jgi:3-hydroxybutyryl-CoA dehydrogenase
MYPASLPAGSESPWVLEAMRMLEQGVASAEGHRHGNGAGLQPSDGPTKTDRIMWVWISDLISPEYLFARLGSETFRPPEVLRRLVSEGKLGKKTGEGF